MGRLDKLRKKEGVTEDLAEWRTTFIELANN